ISRRFRRGETKVRYLYADLIRKRQINFAIAVIAGIIPKAVMAVTVVGPAGVIADRVEADAADVHADGEGFAGLVRDIAKPLWPVVILDAGLGENKRFVITTLILIEYVAQRPV